MTRDDVLARLEAFFRHQLPAATPKVSGLVKTSMGRSRQNWAFDLGWDDGDGQRAEQLILRSDPVGGLVATDRSVEFAVLRALEGTDIPSPVARWLDADGAWFARPSLIMRRATGTCDYYVLNGSWPLPERVDVARQMCDLLAALHGTDWRGAGLGEVLGEPHEAPSTVEVKRWEAVLRRDQVEAYPEIDLAVEWLKATAPAAERTVLVHGDYKPGNVLIEGGAVTTLLDWELAHLGDPLEDIGWVTQPLRRREHIIAGAWEDHDLLDRYQRLSGLSVPAQSVRWWAVFATFRTAVMQVSGLSSFLQGRSDKPYRPTTKVLRTLLECVDG
ncbi:MAG: phosphotransferase family protein [Acidimicrobiales bacterium]